MFVENQCPNKPRPISSTLLRRRTRSAARRDAPVPSDVRRIFHDSRVSETFENALSFFGRSRCAPSRDERNGHGSVEHVRECNVFVDFEGIAPVRMFRRKDEPLTIDVLERDRAKCFGETKNCWHGHFIPFGSFHLTNLSSR